MREQMTLHGKVPADTLGARLELLRRELGWSQRKAAEMTGVPFGTWQGMEVGRRTGSLDQHVAAIAATTGYDRDWLMWGGPLSPPGPPRDNDRYLVAA
jgi:transcriptional regulator with XRE-family HTH domain